MGSSESSQRMVAPAVQSTFSGGTTMRRSAAKVTPAMTPSIPQAAGNITELARMAHSLPQRRTMSVLSSLGVTKMVPRTLWRAVRYSTRPLETAAAAEYRLPLEAMGRPTTTSISLPAVASVTLRRPSMAAPMSWRW